MSDDRTPDDQAIVPSQIPAPAADGDPPRRSPAYDRHMLEALVCPVTRAALTFDAEAQELISRAAHLAFPIRDGIPIMLVDEARKID